MQQLASQMSLVMGKGDIAAWLIGVCACGEIGLNT